MVIAILILLSFGLGFYGGFRLGGFHTARENTTLRNQLMLQERFSKTWAAEATDKYTLSSQINQQQTANLSTTMQTVIHLLGTLQHQQSQTLNSKEKEKVTQLIQQAKSLTSP